MNPQPNVQLSPGAPEFFPSSQASKSKFNIDLALPYASHFLSKFEYRLLLNIVREWSSSPTLSLSLSQWQSSPPNGTFLSTSQLSVLLFNVRGLGERWEEVPLLIEKYRSDCAILTEVGAIELSLVYQMFMNYRVFYQKGENAWEVC